MSQPVPLDLRRARRSDHRVTAALLVTLSVLAATFPFPGSLPPAGALEPPPEPVLGPPPPTWPAPGELDLAAYLLVDGETGQVLAAEDPEVRRAVASTIKVLTALVAVERTDLDDEVTVGDEVEDVPGSGVELEAGDTWTIEELLDALIARSGNNAAEALAVHVGGSVDGFVELMREDAADLGLEDVALVSPSGLDDDNQLSALDLATISRAALAHPELGPILGRAEVVLPSEGEVESRNQLLLDYPDATGVKTGFTIAAGNSVIGSAERDGRELVAVVLGAGEDPSRFEAATTLLDLGFESYEEASIGGRISYAVAGGEVSLVVDEIEFTTPVDREPELVLPMTARAPETDLDVEVLVGSDVVATLAGELDADGRPPPVQGAPALGRAAVDGVYAALRAAAADDDLR